MTHKRQCGYFVALAAAAALVAGCTSDDRGAADKADEPPVSTSSAAQPANAPQPTLTAPSLQPPPQKPSGRPEVTYDPCTWIPDETIKQAGFDSVSRNRPGDQIAETTFLICHFKSKSRLLSVLSGNATWEEDLKKNEAWSEPLTVNDREAIWVHDPELDDGCGIDLRTKAGIVGIVSTLTLNGQSQDLKPCDGLLDIANAVEPTIGKDN